MRVAQYMSAIRIIFKYLWNHNILNINHILNQIQICSLHYCNNEQIYRFKYINSLM